jgi:hypothetical protein
VRNVGSSDAVMTIIQPAVADALRASIAALPERSARELADLWVARAFNEIAAEVFRIAGLEEQAEEIAQLDVLSMSVEALTETLREHSMRVNASSLWSARSHSDCESLRCARRSVATYALREIIENEDGHERACRAAFNATFVAIHVDRARERTEDLTVAPFAQSVLDRIREDIAARTQP